MKLTELTGYKSHPAYIASKQIKPMKRSTKITLDNFFSYDYPSMQEFTKVMADNGWKKINEFGFFANVYQHPNYPYVAKVFVNDNSYLKYFNYIKQNQSNPHVPKVRGKAVRIGNNAYVVRMEPLERVSSTDPVLRKYIDPKLPLSVHSLIVDSNFPFLEEHHPELANLLGDVLRMTEGVPDIHNENVMKRGDTLVITDP